MGGDTLARSGGGEVGSEWVCTSGLVLEMRRMFAGVGVLGEPGVVARRGKDGGRGMGVREREGGLEGGRDMVGRSLLQRYMRKEW